MNKEARIKSWNETYRRATDPEEAMKVKKEEDIKKQKENKIKDTGL